MGMISELPEYMLVQILSWLPTRDVVATMLLSKQWKFLWKQVTKLDYDFSKHDGKDFSEFVTRSMQLQESPNLTSFKLSVSPNCDPKDVAEWIELAVSRSLRELEVDFSAAENPMIKTLPKSLYTCETLNLVKVKALVLEDIPDEYPIRLSSLQYLYLSVSQNLSADKFLGKVLAGAPDLKKSVLQGCIYNSQFIDYMASYNVLKSLTVCSAEWEPIDCLSICVYAHVPPGGGIFFNVLLNCVISS